MAAKPVVALRAFAVGYAAVIAAVVWRRCAPRSRPGRAQRSRAPPHKGAPYKRGSIGVFCMHLAEASCMGSCWRRLPVRPACCTRRVRTSPVHPFHTPPHTSSTHHRTPPQPSTTQTLRSLRSLAPGAPLALLPWLELYWPFVGLGLGTGMLAALCALGDKLDAPSAVLWAATPIYILHQVGAGAAAHPRGAPREQLLRRQTHCVGWRDESSS